MKTIPGAITVLSGALLLGVTCYTYNAYSITNPTFPEHITLIAGLVLCVAGLFAPSVNTEAQPKPPRKFWFSIRDILWLTVVVAVIVAWWLDHRALTGLIPPNIPVVGSGGPAF